MRKITLAGIGGVGVTLATTFASAVISEGWQQVGFGIGVLMISGSCLCALGLWLRPKWAWVDRCFNYLGISPAEDGLRQLDDIGTTLLHLREGGIALQREMSYLSSGNLVSGSEIDRRVHEWTREVWSVVKVCPRDIAHEFYTTVKPVALAGPDPTETRMPLQRSLATWLAALEKTNNTIQRNIAKLQQAGTQ